MRRERDAALGAREAAERARTFAEAARDAAECESQSLRRSLGQLEERALFLDERVQSDSRYFADAVRRALPEFRAQRDVLTEEIRVLHEELDARARDTRRPGARGGRGSAPVFGAR
jgi:hypothetical protein